MVYQDVSDSQSPKHPRPAERGSSQAIQVRPDHPNRVVSPPRGFPSRWHQPQIDLFVMRCNNKLPLFVSPMPDPLDTAVEAPSLPWDYLDVYTFRPADILGKVVEDSPCKSIILIAPGWPNMPWFCYLVAMSRQISLSLPNLPNLLTQPFNQRLHLNQLKRQFSS